MIAIPILKRKSIGTRKESIVTASTIEERMTAIATYKGVSLFVRSLVSDTTQDIPERKLCLSAIFLISFTACIVPSAEVVSSKITIIRVAFSLLNFLYILSGSICIGTEVSAIDVYHTTDLTCSTFSTFSLRVAASFGGIPSATSRAKAPLPKSSSRISCPFIVSISFGRYESMS